jgi:long-chain acyl-CoA synthetase
MSLLTDHLNFGNIYFKDKTYSPETILANIDAVAANLSKRFISNSPFVYLFAPNHIKMVYALFGILKAGKVCVLVDPKLGHFELDEMIKDAAPGAMIRIDKATDTFDFFKEIEVKHYQLSASRIQGLDDVAVMLYTAADDGFAKGAMLTHENLLANARAGIECDAGYDNTVFCSLIPFNHLFALQTGLFMPALVTGDVLIIDGFQFPSVKKTSEQLKKFKVTYLYSVPAVFYLLMRQPEVNDILSSAKFLTSGGYRLPHEVFQSYERNLGRRIQEGYGLSEASPICAWHRLGDLVKPGSVGRAFPCCEVKILKEHDNEVGLDRIGEICVKGSNVMKGYFGNEPATENAIVNDWLHTGDLGKMDDDGYVYLTGLKKRMLNVGGNKVYPAELERLMRKNDNVRNVEIYGEPDEIMGDRVKARIQLRDNTKENQRAFEVWCSSNITGYKVPRQIEFV